MFYPIKHKIKMWRGKRDYTQATNRGKQAIPQSVIEGWTDYRIHCVFEYITFTPGLDCITDLVLLDTIDNLVAVYSTRHPLDPDFEEASFQRGWARLQEMMNEERES